MLTDARARTLALVADLTDQQLVGPRLLIVNPLHWEIGHVAWFQERWVLRNLRGEPPIRSDVDSLYDSAHVPHDKRWSLHLPSRNQTLAYMQRVLDRVLELTLSKPLEREDIYFRLLSLFHEDMHGEAFTYTRQTLAYPCPLIRTENVDFEAGVSPAHGSRDSHASDPEVIVGESWPRASLSTPAAGADRPLPADAWVPGGQLMLGSSVDSGFLFDNEKWAHPVEIRPFRIAREAVTNAEFARFVDERGYERPEFWSDVGWSWRGRLQAQHPIYWQKEGNGEWRVRRFHEVVPLEPPEPVIHVNWYEAEAFCRWAGRRLPNEVEWEAAAAGVPTADGELLASNKRRYPWGNEPRTPERANLDLRHPHPIPVNLLPAGDSACGCRQMIGNVWEWTASDFEPYPGFSADAYQDYSAPWFGGTHKVLRGGAFTTRSRMICNNYRNFYTPDRRDVLAGFRTCGLET